MDSGLKYYVYISDAKVDMLYTQIPKRFLQKIASELSINVKFIADLNATVKSAQNEESRFSKLKIVIKYIEKHLPIGSVDDPHAYFKGTLPMQWGLIKGIPTIYFGGSTAQTILGLGGSPHHIIGNKADLTIQGEQDKSQAYKLAKGIFDASVTNLPDFKKVYQGHLDMLPPLGEFVFSIPDETLEAADRISTHLEGRMQKLEFLARTLLQKPSSATHPKRILLGTPIYVALAD